MLEIAVIFLASMLVYIGLDLLDYRPDDSPRFLNRFLTVLVVPWVFVIVVAEFLYLLIISFNLIDAYERSFGDFWYELVEALKTGR